MAKKFGKVLLATALIGAGAAGAYYFLKKKKEDESFDFDSEDGDDSVTRNYVPLNFEKAGEKVNIFVMKKGNGLSPLPQSLKFPTYMAGTLPNLKSPTVWQGLS